MQGFPTCMGFVGDGAFRIFGGPDLPLLAKNTSS